MIAETVAIAVLDAWPMELLHSPRAVTDPPRPVFYQNGTALGNASMIGPRSRDAADGDGLRLPAGTGSAYGAGAIGRWAGSDLETRYRRSGCCSPPSSIRAAMSKPIASSGICCAGAGSSPGS